MMTTRIPAGLLALALAAPSMAQEAPPSAYGATIRYVDLDTRGSRGQVQEYDGKMYIGAHGDAWLSGQGELGLLDLVVRDIGSTEENGSINADYGSTMQCSVKFDRMTHRQNMTDFAIVLNGVYSTIPPNLSTTKFPRDLNILYKRTELEARLAFFHPENSARWIDLKYWYQLKNGSYPNGYYTGGVLNFAEANVDNKTHEVTVAMGRDLGEKAAMNLDLIARDFKDDAVVVPWNGGVTAVRPHFPSTQMRAGELRWRYDPSRRTAFTGAITGRQRDNTENQYTVKAGVVALNGAHKASDRLALAARLYWRLVETDENRDYRNIINNALGDSHQFDRMTAKADFTATYVPVKPVRIQAGYKVELNHRRDAPTDYYNQAGYADGTFVIARQQANSVATEDTKHIGSIRTTVDLPFGAQADARYQRLHANEAAFVNAPTQSDNASFSLNVPLPAELELFLMSQWLREKNGIQLTEYHLTRNSYQAGLDWQAAGRVFFGADATYESARYNTNGWFGQSGGSANPALSGLVYVPGMLNRQDSTTAGLHGRTNLPKGFVVKANGSYTWSTVATPLRYSPKTDPGQFVGDITPGEVRIARGRVALEYTPPKFKSLTAMASYRIDDWVDKYDPNNSGRASYAQLGVSAKF